MKAMILAAGRGERMRPLTDVTPKPLIKVAGTSLIEYHLKNLVNAGFEEVVINTAWLAEKIHTELGNGSNFGISIRYSDEGEALETAGGIIKALPLLGDEPFLLINGDIWCDIDFSDLSVSDLIGNNSESHAHLILVNNPEHNPDGDFCLNNGLINNTGTPMYTYSGIGIYRAEFFEGLPDGHLALAPEIRNKSDKNLISGQYYSGYWTDVGTVERLQALNNKLTLA